MTFIHTQKTKSFLPFLHYQVITRMNILVAVLCLVMARPYQFYYFVPLVTFWFVVIYVVLAVWPRVTAAIFKGELLNRHCCHVF